MRQEIVGAKNMNYSYDSIRDQTYIGDIYVLEDGFLCTFNFDLITDKITLKIRCPLWKGHPDYFKPLAFIGRYFSSGVYLNSDGRTIIAEFSECRNVSHNIIDSEDLDKSPASIRSWDVREYKNNMQFSISTDIETISFMYDRLFIREELN